ncbi:AAA family ATPase [archaeon]|jgi:thymidylate kinase|nr:AAA family ATPase [archaeon]MBT6761754.1 AAA family ATPase [archaeon]
MAYKIGLIGTHGTGKTTLAALVSGELKKAGIEAKFIGEVATEAKEKGLAINEKTTIQAQMWILYTQFAAELVLGTERHDRPNYQVLICDRGPDNYCYLENSLGKNQHALNTTLGHLEIAPYDKLYLLPIINQGLESGSGTRSLSAQFRDDMDKKVRGFLDTYNINFTELPPPTEPNDFSGFWTKIIVNQTLEDLGYSPIFTTQ